MEKLQLIWGSFLKPTSSDIDGLCARINGCEEETEDDQEPDFEEFSVPLPGDPDYYDPARGTGEPALMLPAKLIDLTGQLQISFLPGTAAAEAQARIVVIQQGQAAKCLISATQMDAIVQSWRRARLEFPGEAWITPSDPPSEALLLPPVPVLLQQLQTLEGAEVALGDTDAAESFCEDCRIDGNVAGNRHYLEAFWYCCASSHLGLAIAYLSKVLELED